MALPHQPGQDFRMLLGNGPEHKFKCAYAGEWKPVEGFSIKTRQDAIKKQLATRKHLSPADSGMTCRQHAPGGGDELQCLGPCGKFKPLKEFSKMARSSGGSQWCTACTHWKLSVEPGILPWAAPDAQLSRDESTPIYTMPQTDEHVTAAGSGVQPPPGADHATELNMGSDEEVEHDTSIVIMPQPSSASDRVTASAGPASYAGDLASPPPGESQSSSEVAYTWDLRQVRDRMEGLLLLEMAKENNGVQARAASVSTTSADFPNFLPPHLTGGSLNRGSGSTRTGGTVIGSGGNMGASGSIRTSIGPGGNMRNMETIRGISSIRTGGAGPESATSVSADPAGGGGPATASRPHSVIAQTPTSRPHSVVAQTPTSVSTATTLRHADQEHSLYNAWGPEGQVARRTVVPTDRSTFGSHPSARLAGATPDRGSVAATSTKTSQKNQKARRVGDWAKPIRAPFVPIANNDAFSYDSKPPPPPEMHECESEDEC